MPPGGGRGAPSKFSPDVAARVIQALRGGNYRNVAAAYAGIHYTTLRKWLIDAEKPDAPQELIDFANAVEKAEADAEVADLALIRRAAQDKDWRAAAWIRERRSPERWGRRDATKVEVSGPAGGPVQVDVGGVVAGDVLAIVALQNRLAAKAASEELGDGAVVEVDGVEKILDRAGVEGVPIVPGSMHRNPLPAVELPDPDPGEPSTST